ncbi:MAG: hypothetical protein ACR2KT_06010 [Methylocella sp.]
MPLKRPINGVGREIFLIVDCGLAHRKRKEGAFVQTMGRKLRWFFLPPRAPDRNHGGLVWKHRKAAGRTAITGKDDFNRKGRSSMRQPQNKPGKIRSFFQNPSLKYAT